AGAAGPDFRVGALAIKHFGMNSQAVPATLLEVSRAAANPGGVAARGMNPEEIRADFLAALAGEGGRGPGPALDLEIELGPLLSLTELGMVFLKEFRDAADGSLACYQQIVEARARVLEVGGAGVLTGPYEVKIHAFDSHPIAADLGLGAGDPLVLRPS